VTYVQYSDDAVALADVRAGRLDAHHGGLPPSLLGPSQREGVRVYESSSGSYSLLVNPAEGPRLNPFSERAARQALNHMVDRSLVVNELLGGHGTPMFSAYAPHDPDYAALAAGGAPEFAYDPGLAREMLRGALEGAGARMEGGAWTHNGEAVRTTVFIRGDDLVRKSIGELLALELERAGIAVDREYGDLSKALAVVYGSDPAELRWGVYTEGWAGKAAFVRYDPVTLHLRIGVKQAYQGAWNPVMGFGDAYSSRIWQTLSDPAVFRNPYSGSPMPVRAAWDVQTRGAEPSIPVPPGALLWDVASQSWAGAPGGTLAASAVTYDLLLSRWHHGEMMDMNDVMHAVYFALEWGSEATPADRTHDAEYASRAAQLVSTLRGVEPLGEGRVRVYVDYWHFDEAEIARPSWAGTSRRWPPRGTSRRPSRSSGPARGTRRGGTARP